MTPESEAIYPVDNALFNRFQLASPDIDTENLSARFRINTADVDREGDIIEPSGVDASTFQITAPVKWEHGFTGISFPIARSIDRDGMFTQEWDPDEDALYARAFFSPNIEVSSQVFDLVNEGFARAASIHVIPKAGFVKAIDTGDHVFRSEEIEYSVCGVGANPQAYLKSALENPALAEFANLQLDAASRILERNRLDSRPIDAALAKCLTSAMPETAAAVRGHTMEKLTLTDEQIQSLEGFELAKSIVGLKEYDEETQKRLVNYTKSHGEKPEAEAVDAVVEEVTEEAAETEAEPKAKMQDEQGRIEPGAHELLSASNALDQLVGHLESVDERTEKPEVRELMRGPVAEHIRQAQLVLQGAQADIYPDIEQNVSHEETPEFVKSWAAERSSQYVLLAVRERLANANPEDLKAKTDLSVKDLDLFLEKAKTFEVKPQEDAGSVPQAKYDELQKAFDRSKKLITKLNELNEKLNKQPRPV